MFFDFFFLLRRAGIKVSLTEWMTLMEALARGLDGASLAQFYLLCRSLCVKSEAQFDLYDQCFAHYFQDTPLTEKLHDHLQEWLKDPKLPRELTAADKAQLEAIDWDKLRQMFEQRLKEQHERHDGGSHWIGTGGTSPFGHGGYHPSGVRVGGPGLWGKAVQVAERRRFANLRHDRVLDTRNMSVALKKLRVLGRHGQKEELDLPATIKATGDNAGDITLVMRPERKNTVHLLLLMDIGGSMTPYTHLSEQLFSAAHQSSHFRSFRHYYFHNTPYETLYRDMELEEGVPTQDVLAELDQRWFILLVGDAAMSPYELTIPGGSVDYFHHNDEPGLTWLNRIRQVSRRSLWLNPEPKPYWQRPSTRLIRQVFPMFPLTVAGVEEAMDHLRQAAANTVSSPQPTWDQV